MGITCCICEEVVMLCNCCTLMCCQLMPRMVMSVRSKSNCIFYNFLFCFQNLKLNAVFVLWKRTCAEANICVGMSFLSLKQNSWYHFAFFSNPLIHDSWRHIQYSRMKNIFRIWLTHGLWLDCSQEGRLFQKKMMMTPVQVWEKSAHCIVMTMSGYKSCKSPAPIDYFLLFQTTSQSTSLFRNWFCYDCDF